MYDKILRVQSTRDGGFRVSTRVELKVLIELFEKGAAFHYGAAAAAAAAAPSGETRVLTKFIRRNKEIHRPTRLFFDALKAHFHKEFENCNKWKRL